MNTFEDQVREIFPEADLDVVHGPLPVDSWATAAQPGYVLFTFCSDVQAVACFFPAEVAPRIAQGIIESAQKAVEGQA